MEIAKNVSHRVLGEVLFRREGIRRCPRANNRGCGQARRVCRWRLPGSRRGRTLERQKSGNFPRNRTEKEKGRGGSRFPGLFVQRGDEAAHPSCGLPKGAAM